MTRYPGTIKDEQRNVSTGEEFTFSVSEETWKGEASGTKDCITRDGTICQWIKSACINLVKREQDREML